MSNFICPTCGVNNIDCGRVGYKTDREIYLENELRAYKDALHIAEEALKEYADEGNWWDCDDISTYSTNEEYGFIEQGCFGKKGYSVAQESLKKIKKRLPPVVPSFPDVIFDSFTGFSDSEGVPICERDTLHKKGVYQDFRVKFGEHTTTVPVGYENGEITTHGWYLEGVKDKNDIRELTRETAKEWSKKVKGEK